MYLNNMPSPENKIQAKNSVLLLYSGGMDSAATAVLFASQFKNVLLLTCSSPYILGSRVLTSSSVRALQRTFPRTGFTQLFEEILPLLHRLRPLNAVAAARSSLLFCTACKLSMHLKAIEVCRREGLRYASSGIGVREQQNFPDQLPDLESRVNKLYEEAGIRMISPMKGRSKAEVKKLLTDYALFPRFKFPRCPVKQIQEFFWFFFGFPADEKILDWYDSQLPLLKRIISEMRDG